MCTMYHVFPCGMQWSTASATRKETLSKQVFERPVDRSGGKSYAVRC
jgi:hypothetical protein